MRRLRQGNQLIEKAPRLIGRRGMRKARAPALGGVGRQRELRYEQQAAADVDEAQVHSVPRTREDAVMQHPLQEAVRLGIAIRGPHADQGEYTPANRRLRRAADVHPGVADALQQCDHRYLRQSVGVNNTRIVNTSRRPSSIANEQIQVWKSLSTL